VTRNTLSSGPLTAWDSSVIGVVMLTSNSPPPSITAVIRTPYSLPET
jgi:hypothetical protein